MGDFRDHILYGAMTLVVLGLATALTMTGHLSNDAILTLLGVGIPSGLGLGKSLTGSSDQTGQTDTNVNRPI